MYSHLFLPLFALAVLSCHLQSPGNLYHPSPAPPAHRLHGRDLSDPHHRYDLDAILAARPFNAYESKVNNNPGGIDHRQRAHENFKEANAAEYGVKPSKIVRGHRPLSGDDSMRRKQQQGKEEEEEEKEKEVIWNGDMGEGMMGRPVVEVGFGYNKGSKYDNGYGHLRAYNQHVDVGAIEAFAAGLAEDPDIERFQFLASPPAEESGAGEGEERRV